MLCFVRQKRTAGDARTGPVDGLPGTLISSRHRANLSSRECWWLWLIRTRHDLAALHAWKVLRIDWDARASVRCRWPAGRSFFALKLQTIKFISRLRIPREPHKIRRSLMGLLRRKKKMKNCCWIIYGTFTLCKFADPHVASAQVRSEVQECAIAVGLLMFGIILERFIEVVKESLNDNDGEAPAAMPGKSVDK